MLAHGLITIIDLIFLCCLAFVPVWVGGQAMKCYDQGHLFRSVVSVLLAVAINMFVLFLVYFAGCYNFNFVTIIKIIHSA